MLNIKVTLKPSQEIIMKRFNRISTENILKLLQKSKDSFYGTLSIWSTDLVDFDLN